MAEVIGMSFWVYCVHAPILNIIASAGHYSFGEGSMALCCLTCANFAVFLVVCIGCGLTLKRLPPDMFLFATSGRV